MARTTITPVVPVIGGVAAAPVAVDATASPNGMQVAATGKTHLAMRVITTGTLTAVTIQNNTPTPEGNTLTPVPVNTPATGTTWFRLDRSWMVQSDGNVYLNFSSATGATVEVLDLGA